MQVNQNLFLLCNSTDRGRHSALGFDLHAHAHAVASTRTPVHVAHTLTQFSKELNSQCCIDEEQQHEEQTQIPHLDRDTGHAHTQIYTGYDTQKKHEQQNVQRNTNVPTDREREPKNTETTKPYCADVRHFLKTNCSHQTKPGVK